MRGHEGAVPTGSGSDLLHEPNLFLDFAALGQRLLSSLELAAKGAAGHVMSGELLLDCFLLAAALSQVLEDYRQRDPLGLRRASHHTPRWLARPVALVAYTELRLRGRLRGARRLVQRQRALDSLVARLADEVAASVLATRGRCSTAAGAHTVARLLLRDAESCLLPLESWPYSLRRAVQRLPNCFRAFDQHPADCLRLVERFAERWPDRSRPLLVVGLRTSGSYLAPLTASFLAAAGYREVATLTLRPGSLLDREQTRAIGSIGAAGGLGLLVDDPPRTGAQLDQAAREVRRHGLSEVVFLIAPASATHAPKRLDGYPMVLLPASECESARQLSPEEVQKSLEDLLVGRTIDLPAHAQTPITIAAVTVDSVEMRSPRRGHTGARIVARLLDGATGQQVEACFYAEGVGLGYFGRHEAAVASALAHHVPATYGVRGGFLFRDWLPEDRRVAIAHLRRAGDAFSRAVARYVSERRRVLSLREDVTLRMTGRDTAWDHLGLLLAHAFGATRYLMRPFTYRAARRLILVERPSVTDACARPDRWFADDAGGFRKIDFQQRGSSNTGIQCCDAVFDLAETAASAEASGDDHLADHLRCAWAELTGEPIGEERWLVYRLLHHLAAYRAALTEAAADPARRETSFSRALELERVMARIQRAYIAAQYLADLSPRTEGPLCAIDIDGVLETRWTAFPALTPAGALALRSLNVHGYRAVLVTGRSLGEVRERCAAYRLPGGVAEYGSVVYEQLGGRTHSLLGRDDVMILDALREALAAHEGVHLDAAYLHSVRAHMTSGDGTRSPVPPDVVDVVLSAVGLRGRVRVIPGDLQTDFVVPAVDKGRGLLALSELLDGAGRRPDIALAVGDTATDLPMLALAKRPFAPANGAAELRGHAHRLRGSLQSGLLSAVRTELGHSRLPCRGCKPRGPRSLENALLLTILAALEGGRVNRLVQAGTLVLRLAAPVTWRTGHAKAALLAP